MGKATKSLSGNSKDKYFRDLFATDPGVAPEAAKRLTETTKREVSQVRVRLPLPERSAKAGHGKAAKTDSAAASTQTVTGPHEQTATLPAAAEATFDPFAFTAVVVLKREGAAALEKLLNDIPDADNLRLLADKQHLGLPADAKSAAELRKAIIQSAEARFADRRAGAS